MKRIQLTKNTAIATLKTAWGGYPSGTYVTIEHDVDGLYKAWSSTYKDAKSFVGDIPESFLN